MTPNQTRITGTLRAFLSFEIAEEVDVLELHRTSGVGSRKREPAFRHPVPEYVKFERTPVIEHFRIVIQIEARTCKLEYATSITEWPASNCACGLTQAGRD